MEQLEKKNFEEGWKEKKGKLLLAFIGQWENDCGEEKPKRLSYFFLRKILVRQKVHFIRFLCEL